MRHLNTAWANSKSQLQDLTVYLIISITDDMPEIDDLATQIRMVLRNVIRRSESLRTPDSPTRSEQGVLVWLDEKGPMSPRALSAAHQVRPQTMQQTLDSLERRHWIKRSDHPDDRRQILFSLSSSGRKALQKGRALRQAWLMGELAKVTRGERKTLHDALGILERFLLDPESKAKP